MSYPYKAGVCGTRAAAKHSAQGWGVKVTQIWQQPVLVPANLYQKTALGDTSWLAGFAPAALWCMVATITYTCAFLGRHCPSSYVPEKLIRWLPYLEDLSAAQGGFFSPSNFQLLRKIGCNLF